MRREMLRLTSSTRKSQQDNITLGEIFGLGETVAKYFFIKSI